MKPTYKLSLLLLLLVSTLIIGISCSKEKSGDTADDQEQQTISLASSASDASAEAVFNGVFDDVMGVSDEVGMSGTGIFGRESGRIDACMTVTVTHPNNTPFPVRVVIDFGSVPCTGVDGHVRSGRIISEYTNRLIVPGAVATTHFEDFYFDTVRVEGRLKTTNTTELSTPLARKFTMQVTDAKLTFPTGNYIFWNSNKTVAQVEGIITPDFPRDDVFQITGSAQGRVLRNNLLVLWESHTEEPLRKRFNCRWIVTGSIKTVRGTANSGPRWDALLNFGAGNCDNRATVTINGVTHEITLP